MAIDKPKPILPNNVGEQLVKEWEAKMVELGLPAELGQDQGARALLQREFEEKGVNIDDMLNRMRIHFINVASPHPGEHKQFFQALAKDLHIDEWDIDEDMVSQVREEIAAAERLLMGLQAVPLTKKAIMLQNEFPDFSDEAIDALIGADRDLRKARRAA